MKNGTLYAKRVKKVYKGLSAPAPKAAPADSTDPLEQLVLAQLSWDCPPTNARRALRKLTEGMIDLNEVRVSTPREIAAVIREFIPDPIGPARNISKSLNGIFKRESRMSLDHLRNKGRREARQYLDSIEGVNPYVSASVMLWSLGGHAVPVSNRLLRALRQEELVDPAADLTTVQTFLERHVAAAEAKVFCLSLEKLAAQKGGRPAAKPESKTVTQKASKKKAGAAKAKRKSKSKTTKAKSRTARRKKKARRS